MELHGLFERWYELNARVVTLYQQRLFYEAADAAKEALRFAESRFGVDHLKVAESLENMALIYFSQAEHSERKKGKEAPRTDQDDVPEGLNERAPSEFVKHKFAESESLLKRALEIRGKTLRPDHPEIIKTLGNLADLFKFQGKQSEAESLLSSVRSRCTSASLNNQRAGAGRSALELNEPHDSRRDIRFRGRFPVELYSAEFDLSVEGTTVNLSRSGAFIQTKDWRKFKLNDKVTVTLFVPCHLSNQDTGTRLKSMARIARIDEEQEGVAVEFIEGLTKFEDTEEFEFPGKVRYKQLAYYISAVSGLELNEFEKLYAHGFLVEKFQSILDKNVIFQFSTQQINEKDILSYRKKNITQPEIFEARVIEIQKRKPGFSSDVITVGRSPHNDIILYNKMVSKVHAYLYHQPEDNNMYIIDLESTNCTLLNAEKLVPQKVYKLSVGDEIEFGPDTKLIYFSATSFYNFIFALSAYYSKER